MKQEKYFIYLIFTFIFIQFCGCNKKPEICHIPQNLKDYTIFQKGSFWIYKNETSTLTDSTFVESITPYLQSGSDKGDPDIETCTIIFNSEIISKTVIYPDGVGIVLFDGFRSPYLYSTFQPGYHDYSNNQPGNPYPSYFKNLNYFDSLVVNNKKYYNIMNTQFYQIKAYNDTVTLTYYIAKFIGLIKINKKVNAQNTTWSLIRSKTVR